MKVLNIIKSLNPLDVEIMIQLKNLRGKVWMLIFQAV